MIIITIMVTMVIPWCGWILGLGLDSWKLEYEFIKNKKFIIVPSKKWYSQHMNNTGTCPDIDSDFLKYPNWPRAENSFGSCHCLQSCMVMGMVHGWWNLLGKISYKTGIALISDRHLSPPTLCSYPALATHHGIYNRHEPGDWHIGEKVNLPRELKMNSPC